MVSLGQTCLSQPHVEIPCFSVTTRARDPVSHLSRIRTPLLSMFGICPWMLPLCYPSFQCWSSLEFLLDQYCPGTLLPTSWWNPVHISIPVPFSGLQIWPQILYGNLSSSSMVLFGFRTPSTKALLFLCSFSLPSTCFYASSSAFINYDCFRKDPALNDKLCKASSSLPWIIHNCLCALYNVV